MTEIIITPYGRHIDQVTKLKIKDANCVTRSHSLESNIWSRWKAHRIVHQEGFLQICDLEE